MYFPIKREHGIFNWSETTNESSEHPSPPPRVQTIYMITSTEPRSTQKLDLTSLCQTLMHVSNLVWIVVEASSTKGRGVAKVLERCQVPSVHLSVPEGSGAIQQGNAGLKFLVEALCDMQRCDGVVCFGLDSTKYDLRLFKEVIVCMCCVCVCQNLIPLTLLLSMPFPSPSTLLCLPHPPPSFVSLFPNYFSTDTDQNDKRGVCLYSSILQGYAGGGTHMQEWPSGYVDV